MGCRFQLEMGELSTRRADFWVPRTFVQWGEDRKLPAQGLTDPLPYDNVCKSGSPVLPSGNVKIAIGNGDL
jgi:hypothetical protein